MVIEYQITFQTGGFTITQRVDPNGLHGAQPVTTAPQTEGIAPPANRTKPQDGILMNRLPDTRHQVAAAHVAVAQLSRPAGDPSTDPGHGGFNPGGDPSAEGAPRCSSFAGPDNSGSLPPTVIDTVSISEPFHPSTCRISSTIPLRTP